MYRRYSNFEYGNQEDGELSPDQFEHVSKMAEQYLDREAVDMDSFVDQYSLKEIREDKEYVKKLETEFEESSGSLQDQRNKQLATIFEALVHLGGTASKWFGSKAKCIRASRYDDIKKHVDEILEFVDAGESSHLGVFLDVTSNLEAVDKFQEIKAEIDRGQLVTPKYFKDNIPGMTRAVIEADPVMVRQMASLWERSYVKSLHEHYFQILMLEQLLTQLSVYASYAHSIGQGELASVYLEAFNRVKEILKEKEPLRQQIHADRNFVSRSTQAMARLKDNLRIVFKPAMAA